MCARNHPHHLPVGTTGPRLCLAAGAGLLSGCSHSPTVSIFGSYFPTWLLFAVAGLVIAFVVRAVCLWRHWDDALPAPVLFYVACALTFTFGGYWIWVA